MIVTVLPGHGQLTSVSQTFSHQNLYLAINETE